MDPLFLIYGKCCGIKFYTAVVKKTDTAMSKMLQHRRMGQIVFLKVLLMSIMCPQLQYVLSLGQSLWEGDKEDVEMGDENYWEHDTISVMTDCQDWDCLTQERNEFKRYDKTTWDTECHTKKNTHIFLYSFS